MKIQKFNEYNNDFDKQYANIWNDMDIYDKRKYFSNREDFYDRDDNFLETVADDFFKKDYLDMSQIDKKFINDNINMNNLLESKDLSNMIEIVDIEVSEDENDKEDEYTRFEIDEVLDIISPKDAQKYENVTTHVDVGGKDYKRGDTIYISALIRKAGTSSYNSPSRQAVLKCRITDIYFGLQYLNRVIN